jgi:hypothetical protein
MSNSYVPFHLDGVHTLVPVDPDEVVAIVMMNGVEHGQGRVEGAFLVVERDGQQEVPLRNRTFDVIGPASLYGTTIKRLMGERFESMVRAQAVIGGLPRHGAETFAIPLRAGRILKEQFPGSYYQTYALVYPLHEPSDVFDSAVTVYLYEGERERVEVLLAG